MSSLDVFVGIDLGSTTTKAVVLNAAGETIGRGITNSRSNYDVACGIARQEAFVSARFNLTQAALASTPVLRDRATTLVPALSRSFRLQQHLGQLGLLRGALHNVAGQPRYRVFASALHSAIDRIADAMLERAPAMFGPFSTRKSDFFRDVAAADYMQLAEQHVEPKRVTFDVLASLFDAAILPVENTAADDLFETHIGPALDRVLSKGDDAAMTRAMRDVVMGVRATAFCEVSTVGTGYGKWLRLLSVRIDGRRQL